ncbi:MAG: endolytic transglycosylase MltG [Desulfobacterales bacterium]|nr:endolytic transglycosylase MltG [Desulfobacterales bacterium]MDJ0875747.1 endolytic transglycosylase MltG [Desulfobacterales bacterium]MDJ0885514.1 endolytic transglycosylase MltG [Desulfobacterales bacterium]
MKYIKILAILVLLPAAGMGLAVWDVHRYARQPDAVTTDRHTVTIRPGEGFGAITARLQDKGLIKTPFKFRLYARFGGYHTQLKAGEYELSGQMSPRQILETLKGGKVRLYRVTIPEGYHLRQIAEAIAAAGFGSAEAFHRLATDPEEVRNAGLEAQTLEGYLFPDTYHFPRGLEQRAIIDAMLKRFHAAVSDQWRARAREIGLSLHEVVTLASIIEKETGDPAERPLISSVFHNRLRKGMRLETDPTVIYGIKDFNGNLTRKDLRTPTPYNTYVIRGLPPGPIASPGAAALEAALYPAESDYLFFVSRRDRTHQFSTNWKDHNQAVREYQLRRRKKK